ncbi:aminotransferase class I/II-fold pyridoxal phosphate-dependent enzyme [Paracoccaceae bacterium]|nr:aminotransferase class I/II-fold pyridoxal phosphate-dependent enzyme [Paracoccaceae bacterium]
MYPERFSHLPEYAFPRFRALLDGHDFAGPQFNMTIGEPQHRYPAWIKDVLLEQIDGFNRYPANDGIEKLQVSIVKWFYRRFGLELTSDKNIVPLNGTREGLYNVSMALCPESLNGKTPFVLIPNPFYQVYMISALSVNAEPLFIPTDENGGHLPDYFSLTADILNNTSAAYICSPSNPQGAVATVEYVTALIELAEKYDFIIFSDECYSEIYRDTPPPGFMEISNKLGADPNRVVTFHSLSKRSNLPGLRSGFAASGEQNIKRMKQLRAYSGSPIPEPLQHISASVWDDEEHVIENRKIYKKKYDFADKIFTDFDGYLSPTAGFFLWLDVGSGEKSALKLWQSCGVRVLPGRYLSKDFDGQSPGDRYIRVAMVAEPEETKNGLIKIREFLR